MKTVFIIHGSDDDSQKHWFPWLKSELEAAGYEVIAPDFPCEDGHQLSAWLKVFEPFVEKINEDSIFIGHSRGCAFIWRLLEKIPGSIDSCFLVGGFSKYLWYPKENGGLDTFYETPFEWELMKKKCKYFKVYQSTNDSYVPVEIGKDVAHKLDAEIEIVEGAGHFRTVDGYETFPRLLNEIKARE